MLAFQQYPRANGNLLPPKKPVNFPWNAQSARVTTPDVPPPYPSVVHELLPLPAYNFRVIGITKDSAGAVLGSCTVKLFRTSDDALMGTTTSDATTGAYEFRFASPFFACSAVARDPTGLLVGVTLNTLVGT